MPHANWSPENFTHIIKREATEYKRRERKLQRFAEHAKEAQDRVNWNNILSDNNYTLEETLAASDGFRAGYVQALEDLDWDQYAEKED